MILYDVMITNRAEIMLYEYLSYLVNEKDNMQAAIAVSDDFDETVEKLKKVAGSLRFCDDADLQNRKIRKIFLQRHNYVLLYKLTGNTAVIEAIYHTLQDYENLFRDDH